MAKSEENFEQIIAEIEAQEKGGNTEKSTEKVDQVDSDEVFEDLEGESDDIQYAHEKILSEEGLTKNDMPDDIKKMINTFNRKKLMAERNDASEETFLKIQNLSTLIADQIITHLEEKDKKIFDDGGGIDATGGLGEGADDGMDDGGADDDGTIISDGDVNVDDGVDEIENPPSSEDGESKGIFDGILGGIFNWND